MKKQLDELKAHLLEANDLSSAAAVLSWDQATYMPQAGAVARGRQMATLQRLAFERMVDPKVGRLLEELDPQTDGLDPDSDDVRMVQATRRIFDRMTKVPPQLIGQFTAHSAESYAKWAVARPTNDFASIAPSLQKTLDFSRKIANCFEYDHIADPLIDQSDYGMKAESVKALFAELRSELVPLVEAITEQEAADNSCLKQHFPEADQRTFGEDVIRAFGFDFNRGRQDLTLHPFMTKFAYNDVRITTRFDENELGDGLFSTLHEAGHAMYELGVSADYEGTPLDGGTSSGVHESQSRLWENIVGRSHGFWQHYYPKLQATFPTQLNDVPLDTFYRAINKVERSLIRVDADECTYNLHIMIRFDLAMQLLEGTLSITDLPDAWHARYKSDLGIRAENDSNGVMQDVHWFAGLIGGSFQGYTLGNIMSAAFYDKALEAHPAIPDEIASGEFGTLHTWLRTNIYHHGSKFPAPELVERVTGESLTIKPYMNYLRNKFGALYAI